MNEGILNEIKSLDRSDLTELIFNIQNILNGNNLKMYGFQLSKDEDDSLELVIKEFGYITKFGSEVTTELTSYVYVLDMETGDIDQFSQKEWESIIESRSYETEDERFFREMSYCR